MRSIERWLIERAAFYLERPADDVDPAVPLAEAGFDSVAAVSLCGDVESHWEIEADPTLVFDYPTITAIAEFISAQIDVERAA
jgi:acyl carrier protein